ncbi:MAG: 4Fe-4S binding protein [Chloroflexota bacterium]
MWEASALPKAVVDPERCRPHRCADGLCPVRKSCPTRAIRQEEPFDTPASDPSRCHGCSKCVAACPLRAIFLSQ